MRRFIALLVFPLAAILAGCSNTAPTATAPSGVSSASAGATISGSIQATAVAGVSVTAPGTGRTTMTGSRGEFLLTGVPEGTAELRFTGAALDASLAIASVRDGQMIEISVAIAGNTATVSSERRSGIGEEEIEGVVDAVGTGGTFTIAGRQVTTDAATVFRQGTAPAGFAALAAGQRVRVKGRTVGSSLLAVDVDIRVADDDRPGTEPAEVETTGVIDALSGSADAFSFRIGSLEFRGDRTTVFVEAAGFAGLANGVTVEVKGVRDAGGVVRLTRVHLEDEGAGGAAGDDDRDDDDGADAGRSTGTLSAVAGSGSALTLTIGGRTVTTSAATEVRRRGDRVPLDVLQIGMVVEVEGSTSGGAVLARKLTIESDGHDADVEAVVGGPVTGACPVIRFTAGGRAVETTVFTGFKDVSCAAIAAGTRVKVRGVVHPDGHIVATRVEGKD
ncbi:MAG: DUF5666 domain-containing protein [Vicinamibacterales bacterium]